MLSYTNVYIGFSISQNYCKYFFPFFVWDWSVNSGLHAYKISTLLLQSILLCFLFFLEMGSHAGAGLEL
jgi:hypothetical protein